ncbi:unnamed protein product [Tuber melanosporum]|uniref:(Perigord truffle) hypothetical protein n=1 Tax=Tuber melanosporum (strain Mel28) TaxID=656061 RepID=D5GAI5_TUBMM|nr:uncharacterized protein GSTUM_00003604001 [Tuber melanosporum]CAZ81528.1 unnamed protein product [Tuber melanosporum]
MSLEGRISNPRSPEQRMDSHHPRQLRSYAHYNEGGRSHPDSRPMDGRANLRSYQQEVEISYDEKPRCPEDNTPTEGAYGHSEGDKSESGITDEGINQGHRSKSNGDISQGLNLDTPNNPGAASVGDATQNISKDEPEPNLTNDLTSETQQPGKGLNSNHHSSTEKESGNMANSKDTLSTKDPNELRQKVLESLAEKKKKAAVFITQESEGTGRKEASPESRVGPVGMNTTEIGSGNDKSPTRASASNPEREAAVNALLAEAMGSSKTVSGKVEKVQNAGASTTAKNSVKSPTEESFDQTRRRKNYPEEIKASGMTRGPSGEFHENTSPIYDDPETSRRSSFAGHHSYPRNDKQSRPKRSPEDLPRREGAYKEDYSHSSRQKISPTSASRQEFPRVQRAYEHEERDRNDARQDARQDARHRTDRFEDPPPSAKEFRHPPEKPGASRRGDGDYRGKYLEEEKLRTREEPSSYRSMDVAREDDPRDPYPRYSRRMVDPNWQDQGPDAPPYPTGRYLPPRDDHRLPPITRPPETDYAALYYKDLTEWLEVTGYHDHPYRQMVLRHQRDLRAMEDRRIVIEDERDIPRVYPGVPLREDVDPRDPRRTRGPPSYTLMPSEMPPRDERDPSSRVPESTAHRSSSRAALYPPLPRLDDRTRYQGDLRIASPQGEAVGLKRRAPFRDEYDDAGPVGKSARVNYENQHRSTTTLKSGDYVNAEQSGTHMKHHSGHTDPVDHRHPSRRITKARFEDPEDDAAGAVRQSLSKRIATGRGREQSPPPLPLEARVRERSLSPRHSYDNNDRKEGHKQGPPNKPHRDGDNGTAFVHPQRKGFEKGRRTPEPSGPRYEKDLQKPGRSVSGKFTPREDFRKPFPGRRSSSDDYRSPGNTLRRGSIDEHKKRPFGRGRGRGYTKEFHPSTRHNGKQDYGDPMDFENRVGPVIDTRGAGTRYFVVKSFNHDNVKMAQKDELWATQKKNSETFEEAFKTSRDVILVFSVNKSGKFQGYARMESAPGTAPVPTWAKNLLWESSGPFRIRWVTINDINFHRVAHLTNRLNEDQPVLIGRDGQEIDPECGAALCRLIDESANFHRIYNENGGK